MAPDHAIPLSAGGPHTFENLATSCGACNYQWKGSCTLDELGATLSQASEARWGGTSGSSARSVGAPIPADHRRVRWTHRAVSTAASENSGGADLSQGVPRGSGLQPVVPCPPSSRRRQRRASRLGGRRSGCTRATCATDGISRRSRSVVGRSRSGTVTPTGSGQRGPHIFSSGPPKPWRRPTRHRGMGEGHRAAFVTAEDYLEPEQIEAARAIVAALLVDVEDDQADRKSPRCSPPSWTSTRPCRSKERS